MSTITAGMVSELRARTGAGIMDCKKALSETSGDVETAIEFLRKTGVAKAAKKAGRTTAEGLVHSYIHEGGRIGVLIEVNCETDFVARNDAFKTLVRDLAMHVAAADPMGIDRDDIPADVVDRERSLLVEQAKATGKPEAVVEKMVTGQLDKFFGERVLTEQVFVKDPDGKKKVGDLLAETIVKIGENIKVNRFSRFQLGEE